jgi:3-oxoacyl-[acyl-carrier protein] reductase
MEEDQWRRVIDTSLHGFFHVTRPLIMPMIRQRWGRIVSISSIAALHGNRGQTNYAAAKAGLIGATRSLAKEVASRGICANVVAPGFVDTGMIDDIPADIIREVVPMKRAGSAAEIAAVVAFLCSDDASYITGEVVNVSGGII